MKKMYKKNSPYQVPCKPGEQLAICLCGHSDDPPFCSGAHKKKAPEISPKIINRDHDETLYICGCGESKNIPECDGTHNTCPENEAYRNRW
ncbi:MAG: CDGSH iron-sulfur domain-containing protein [Magnetococcales bacterium]|nr:CDGSH iron-sulfur domain-containing protein [Magnetococcales bacterium]